LHEEHFPKQFAGFFPHMKIHNWLFNYRSHEGMKRSLTGLYRRAQYMPSPEKAFDLFIENYSPLNDQYELLMPEMISFVLEKINKPA
jgi:acyl carrier protein phosphodiesterase